jgi:hypothetical protein
MVPDTAKSRWHRFESKGEEADEYLENRNDNRVLPGAFGRGILTNRKGGCVEQKTVMTFSGPVEIPGVHGNHSGRSRHDDRRKEEKVVQASAVRFVRAGLDIQQGAKRRCACQHLSSSEAFFRGRIIPF